MPGHMTEVGKKVKPPRWVAESVHGLRCNAMEIAKHGIQKIRGMVVGREWLEHSTNGL